MLPRSGTLRLQSRRQSQNCNDEGLTTEIVNTSAIIAYSVIIVFFLMNAYRKGSRDMNEKLDASMSTVC
jgi:hypothetical protein